jgi:hypothetical protein
LGDAEATLDAWKDRYNHRRKYEHARHRENIAGLTFCWHLSWPALIRRLFPARPSPIPGREEEIKVRTCAGAVFAGMGTTEAVEDDAVVVVSTLLIARTGSLGGIVAKVVDVLRSNRLYPA